ncbi:MAG: low temperature requirement protein A, partial [Coriobacteriales bacterium]|nr:low temperature requirement protein A [Coriobacteriales bacterium]
KDEATMLKRDFKPAEGVSNIELFYDLIFVYCISVVTSLCSDIPSGFFDHGTWIIYMFSLSVILQIWLLTTLLMNRYGDRSLPETAGLFINMFLLYFLANGVQTDWHETSMLFNLTWAGILLNLALQWFIKLRSYTNIDEDDRHIMTWSISCLLVQAGIAALAGFLPEMLSVATSWITLLFGMGVWMHSGLFRKKSARFSHLTERCALLTIIAFGEMVVGISTYMMKMSSIWFPIGVFALAVGLFLIFIFEHDHMLNHHAHSHGMTYLTISTWLIVVISNFTVAVQYMPRTEIDAGPKNLYLAVCLVLYLLTSFLLSHFNKPEFRHSTRYVVGRVAVCIFILVMTFVTAHNPAFTLSCHVIAVYAAFAHEWILWYRGSRKAKANYGRSLGLDHERESDPSNTSRHGDKS